MISHVMCCRDQSLISWQLTEVLSVHEKLRKVTGSKVQEGCFLGEPTKASLSMSLLAGHCLANNIGTKQIPYQPLVAPSSEVMLQHVAAARCLHTTHPSVAVEVMQ